MPVIERYDPDAKARHVQVDRLARYIWQREGAREDDWTKYIDDYRYRARLILTTPEGWRADGSYIV